ncbi:MAG: PH domain-containing protein, partial [Rhodospirillales bacterium]|nr:PH domain-containing protein [Rhodospirillales bacterium]
PLTPRPDARLSYLLLWPHVRAGRGARAMPMLRAVPEAEAVAACLADALTAHGVAPRPLATPIAPQAARPAIQPAGANGEASPA